VSDQWGRRDFIGVTGSIALTSVIAGCSSSSSSSEDPTATETQRTTPTSTPTPTPTPTDTDTPAQIQEEDFGHLVGLTAETHLGGENQGDVTREYVTYPDGERVSYTHSYSRDIYQFYANQARQYVDNYQFKYGSYVSDMLDKYLMNSIVSEFEQYGQDNGYTERQVIEHMMSFVQNLEYTDDKRGTGFNDYLKYPLETLVEQDGDCEDTAILMANLLRNYGYGTKLIYASGDMTDGDVEGHMAVGIKGNDDVQGTYYTDDNGDCYYFIETTAPGIPIGEAPSWMNRAYLQPVGIHPVLGAVFGEVTEVHGNQVTVVGETLNTGPVESDNVQIRLTLIDSDRYIVDEATSEYKSVTGFDGDIDNLGQEHQATTELTLQADQPEGLRLVAESLVRGDEVSQTESPLRSPSP
jgi:predicted transglutaminase-like cysteine proteinase